MRVEISDVRSFWSANPCQSRLSRRVERRKYFEEISRKRFQGRDGTCQYGQFDCFGGKDVLEIGCGVEPMVIEFARNGANYIGVDLTKNR